MHRVISRVATPSSVAFRVRAATTRSVQQRAMATQPNTNRGGLISQKTAKEWKELSTPQKVVRASKTTVNLGVILAGMGLTGALIYFVGSELFGTQSSTAVFNDAVDRIRAHPQLSEVIGEPIKAHGQPSRSRMKRNRRIHHRIMDDQDGKTHLLMQFFLEGSENQGTAMVDMVKDDKGKWQYRHLFVDVPGQGYPSQRYFVEGA